MIYTLLIILFFALVFLALLALKNSDDFAQAKFTGFLNSRLSPKTDYISEFDDYVANLKPELSNLIGDKIFSRFIIPIFVIFLVSILGIAPILVGLAFVLPLALIITLAYASRIYYSFAENFRSKVLLQIERIFRSIRNNLSTGMTLDYAVNNAIKFNMEKPLGPQLQSFINLSQTNFLENFPKWLMSLKESFHIKELGKSAQLLALELQYSNNQEDAFLNAVNQIANRISLNRKQKNTVLLALFTMDFMVIALFAVLFFVIPNISTQTQLSWWNSSERSLIVFISAGIVWLAYFITVLIMIRRQS